MILTCTVAGVTGSLLLGDWVSATGVIRLGLLGLVYSGIAGAGLWLFLRDDVNGLVFQLGNALKRRRE